MYTMNKQIYNELKAERNTLRLAAQTASEMAINRIKRANYYDEKGNQRMVNFCTHQALIHLHKQVEIMRKLARIQEEIQEVLS